MKRIAYLTALAGVAAASAYAAHRAWKHYKHLEQDATMWRGVDEHWKQKIYAERVQQSVRVGRLEKSDDDVELTYYPVDPNGEPT